jgi:arginyl-tRNA synthetase
MKQIIRESINKVLASAQLRAVEFEIEYPADLKFGDYSSNVAMVLAKNMEKNPRDLAQVIVNDLNRNLPLQIDRVEMAGSGFINFYLKKEFIFQKISEVFLTGNHYGRTKKMQGQKIIIEYTDPNPFKQFHIGHLMSNSIGESLSRILEWNGAELIRFCYQGDVGMHVAKALWGMIQNKTAFPHDNDSLEDKMKFIGSAYAFGSARYDEDENAKAEINEINKKVFAFFNGDPRDDDNELKIYYDKGKKWSLAHFDEIYGKLGTNFDRFIFESSTSALGEKIVRENIKNPADSNSDVLDNSNSAGVFELSDGAIVYKGEQDGLHTRVFINSQGLPTYEAKDLGLAFFKDRIVDFDKSIVITASEQTQYFKVMLAALKRINRDIAEKTIHIVHGMMLLPAGKMSSRKGSVIAGEALIKEAEQMVRQIIADRELDEKTSEKIVSDVAISAIKYSILKQATGRDIIYNPQTAVTFDGDSGPYLQYTVNRAKSVLGKAFEAGIEIENNLKNLVFGNEQNFSADKNFLEKWQTINLERLILRFPEMVELAGQNLTPHSITNYLIQVAGDFNSFYASNQIIDHGAQMAYKLALTKATQHVLQNGLQILGIRVPERM